MIATMMIFEGFSNAFMHVDVIGVLCDADLE